MHEDLKRIVKTILHPLPPYAIIILMCMWVLYFAIISGHVSVTNMVAAGFILVCSFIFFAANLKSILLYLRYMLPKNKAIKRFMDDKEHRAEVILVASMLGNGCFVIFYFFTALYNKSWWFMAIAIYYLFLVGLRVVLVRNIYIRQDVDDHGHMKREGRVYRQCGILLLIGDIIIGAAVIHSMFMRETQSYGTLVVVFSAAVTFFKVASVASEIYDGIDDTCRIAHAMHCINMSAVIMAVFVLQTVILSRYNIDPALLTRINGAGGIIVFLIIFFLAVNMLMDGVKIGRFFKMIK